MPHRSFSSALSQRGKRRVPAAPRIPARGAIPAPGVRQVFRTARGVPVFDNRTLQGIAAIRRVGVF